MPIAEPPQEIEEELRRKLAESAAEYADEERAAAEEEIREREERDRASLVYSVRLPREVYDAVRALAEQQHLTPSALIRQWVSERVDQAQPTEKNDGDLTDAVATLRRDVERLARLTRPA